MRKTLHQNQIESNQIVYVNVLHQIEEYECHCHGRRSRSMRVRRDDFNCVVFYYNLSLQQTKPARN
jgi:hypothetical protein